MAGTLENGATVWRDSPSDQWHVEPAWREAAIVAGRIDNYGAQSNNQTRRFRTIYRLKSNRLILRRHCRPVGVRAWLRELLRPAKAVLESSKIVAVAARRVAALEPSPAASAGRGPATVPVWSLNDAASSTLSHRGNAGIPRPKRRSFASGRRPAWARSWPTHAAGVCIDLHGQSARHLVGRTPRFTLIDLHDATVAVPCRGATIGQLIPFNHGLSFARPGDRLRSGTPIVPDRTDSRRSALEAQTWRSTSASGATRAPCVATNRHFRRCAAGVSGHSICDFRPMSGRIT